MKKATMVLAISLAFCMMLSACQPSQGGGGTSGGGDTPTEPCVTCVDSDLDGYCDVCKNKMPDRSNEKADKPTIKFHYKRKDGDYKTWSLWLWDIGGNGSRYTFTYVDDFGGVVDYPLTSASFSKGVGVIPSTAAWKKDGETDRIINLSDYVMDENNYYHIYMTQGGINLYMDSSLKQAPKITSAEFSSSVEVIARTSVNINYAWLYKGETVISEKEVNDVDGVRLRLPEGQSVELGASYKVKVQFVEDNKVAEKVVDQASLYGTSDFVEQYVYDGQLGAIYTKESTTFKVWSPISSKIVLNLYNVGYDLVNVPTSTVEMEKGEKGVFSATVNGDLSGKYYTYTVYNYQYPDGQEIVDPYAQSAGTNGVRGMVVDFDDDRATPAGWDQVTPHAYDRKELTVWETHVADVTSSATWTGEEKYRKQFKGMIQSGTTYTENGVTVKTGFDHIVELGVNAVQIIPFFDQANDEGNATFNWGYNPLNYNVVEGSYSSNPRDGYVRIKELREVVAEFNKAGINIIMDVVYNHVNGAAGSNFDVLMPGYYYRYTDTGALSNGSGCGNEVASEREMVCKFIIDSVCFWAKEYKLGGFRFDLMGLLDIKTMNELVVELEKINPNIVVYGEPWTGGTTTLQSSQQAVQANGNSFQGYGQFNDQMRDALIKGGMSGPTEKGWITNYNAVNNGDVSKILSGLKGITAGSVTINDPNKTVNYVTCHDNYTLYDRIRAAGITNEATVRKMAMLANSVVFTSNGTTFMLAGDEFLRTKGGDSNSYQSSYKVNELNYALKIKNIDIFQNYQKLISFKQETDSLHLEQAQMSGYNATSLAGGAVIQITFNSNGKDYKIIHANGCVDNFATDFAGYTLYLDTIGDTTLSAQTTIKPFQTIIAYK